MKDKWNSRRSTLASAMLLVFSSLPAGASGGLWCNIDDANLKLNVESGVTHGMGGPFFNFKASAELLAKDVADDFRHLTLDNKLVHSWLDGDETRLLLYVEREGGKPFGSVEILIETSGDREEIDLKGTYEVSYFEAARQQGDNTGLVKIIGDVTCGGE